MGLFSKQNSSTTDNTSPQRKTYVFIRSSVPSSENSTTWSLAVSEKTDTSPESSTENSSATNSKERRLSRLFARPDSKPTTIEPQQPTNTTTDYCPSYNLHEYTISSGTLKTTTHRLSSKQTHTKDPTSSLLLQIQLPPPPSHHHTHPQNLPSQITQTLHHLASSTHQTEEQVSPWPSLKSTLLALQHSTLLPPASSGFNVERFMDFAQNSLVEFERDVSRRHTVTDNNNGTTPASTTTATSEEADLAPTDLDLGAKHVKQVDYAAHVVENERLRKLFGHSETGEVDEKSRRRSWFVGVNGGGDGNGGWWVSRPQEVGKDGRRSDPYGGLM